MAPMVEREKLITKLIATYLLEWVFRGPRVCPWRRKGVLAESLQKLTPILAFTNWQLTL